MGTLAVEMFGYILVTLVENWLLLLRRCIIDLVLTIAFTTLKGE